MPRELKTNGTRQANSGRIPNSMSTGLQPFAGFANLPIVAGELDAREQAWLAPYATRSRSSRGRKHAEPTLALGGPFAVDRERILRSTAYRRLGGKTQVFSQWGDYHRTRLTHTLEVCALARNVGRALRLNEDLIEALALAHDLGHPPFGHAGEAVLDQCLAGAGGFCHNRQALVIVEQLEQIDPSFPGLNLSAEVLAGQAQRLCASRAQGASLEAQAVEAADSAAYDLHDADDAVELGLLALEELLELDLWKQAARRVRARYSGLDPTVFRRALVSELLAWQTADLIRHSERRLREAEFDPARLRDAADPIVAPGAEMAEFKAACELLLTAQVYRHPRVMAMRHGVQDRLRELFDWLSLHPDRLPPRYAARVRAMGLERAVGDYLAGMTDRYALECHGEWIARAAH